MKLPLLVLLTLAIAAGAAARPFPRTRPSSTLTLANEFVRVDWDAESHALQQLTAIQANGVATPFLSPTAIAASGECWWNMYVTTPETPPDQAFLIDAFTLGTTKAASVTDGDGYQNATFTYSIPIASSSEQSPNNVTVVVTAQLFDTASTIDFYASIVKQLPDFPIALLNATILLQGINPDAGGKRAHRDGTGTDLLILPSGFGMLVASPLDQAYPKLAAHYPNSDATYCSVMYYFNSTNSTTQVANGPGLFLEAHDPLGAFKVITYEPSPAGDGTLQLSLTLFPTNAGQDLSQSDTSTSIAAYPIVWGVFQGDWSDGIATYANWALTNAQWVSAGLVEERLASDMASWLVDINWWMNTGWQEKDIFNATEGDPEVVLARVAKMLEVLDLPSPIGLHWYEWDPIKFDTKYPEYLPAKPGVKEAVEKMRQTYQGMLRIAPYINGRIFDVNTTTWVADDAESYACKQIPQAYQSTNYTIFNETYGSGAYFSVMCPATDYWQQKLASITSQLVGPSSLLQMDGIYIDQIASSETEPCADPTHGHTIADGQSWITGYAEMLQAVQGAIGGAHGNASFIVTESNAESYMAHVSVYLTLVAFRVNITGPYQSLVPVFPRIYGGRYLSMGAEWFLSDLQPNPNTFAAKLVWQWHQGTVLGWISLGGTATWPKMGLFEVLTSTIDPTQPESALVYQPEIDWLRQLDAFRTLARNYLVFGRRTRDVAYTYSAAASPSASTADVEEAPRYSHPHSPSLRAGSRPTHSAGSTPKKYQAEAHHGHIDEGEGASAAPHPVIPFIYSPLQSSVWLSGDGSALGLFFSCSQTPSASEPSAYTVAFQGVDLANYGIPGASAAQPWTLHQWDQFGELITVQEFATGTAVAFHTVLQCRQLIYLEFVQTSTLEAAKAAQQQMQPTDRELIAEF